MTISMIAYLTRRQGVQFPVGAAGYGGAGAARGYVVFLWPIL